VTPGRRFQGDAEWQRDFGRIAEVMARCREHTLAGRQLANAKAPDEARAELQLAEEENELAELMAESLSSIR
jgi:hypothetical protein